MKCKYAGCDHESDHRPYSKDRIPSVSTIAGLLDNNKSRGFAWSASLIAASVAVHEPERWRGLVDQMTDRAAQNGYHECTQTKDGLCKACNYLRSEHDRVWRAKADLGGHVHHLALQWAQGEKVLTDPIVDPYMDALQGFYGAHGPLFVELERTVLCDSPKVLSYRGQFDFIADIRCPDPAHERCRWLIDIKTGGFHVLEQTLQLVGYRNATHITDWKDGTETIIRSMPAVGHCGVLLLGGDGEFRLVELAADNKAAKAFTQLRDLWGFAERMRRWEKDLDKQEKTV